MPPVKITSFFKPKNIDKEPESLEQPVEQPDEATPAKQPKLDETEKVEFDVISCEPAGMDMKGNKICDIDKKQLRISDKQRISVWDILEGHKNPAPLSWVWFGAVKSERKSLAYEETHRSLKYHAHNLTKSVDYFYESLPLPPEEIDPVPERICIKDEMKPDTPLSVDQSPSAAISGKTRGKGTTRKRKPKNSKTSPTNVSTTSQLAQQTPQTQVQSQTTQQINTQNQINQMQMHTQQFTSNQQLQQNSAVIMQQQLQGSLQQLGNTQNTQMGYLGTVSQGVPQISGQNQHQQWIAQAQYHPIQQQQQFFSQQGNRFERPQLNQSKQALCNMLRQRQPAFNQNNTSSYTAIQPHQQLRQAQGVQTQNTIGPVPQQFVRGGMRSIATTSGINISQNVNQNAIISTQVSSQSMNSQSTNQMTMTSSSGIINNAPNNQNSHMNIQTQSELVGSGNVLQQNMASANANQNLLNQAANPFHGYSQYQQPGILNNSGGTPPSSMITPYNQMGQRNNNSDYLQQRTNNAVSNNRGQFVSQTPNVTMGNIIGQNNIPPYSRQQTSSGKPSVVSSQQQFQQQQRLHHQMMHIQGGMVQSQNQNINQQQTPNLVAQLQRQLPNQQNMPTQQYQHHQTQY